MTLQQRGPVRLRARFNYRKGSIVEFLYQLTSEFHNLRCNLANLGHLILYLLHVLLIDIVVRLGLLEERLMSRLQTIHDIQSLLDERPEGIYLILSQELSLIDIASAESAQIFS